MNLKYFSNWYVPNRGSCPRGSARKLYTGFYGSNYVDLGEIVFQRSGVKLIPKKSYNDRFPNFD